MGKNKSYLLKVDPVLWDSFREANREAGFGVSVNQRVNFWLRNADFEALDLHRPVEKGSGRHGWVLEIYNVADYNRFKRLCAQHNVSVNKALNLLIMDFVERGALVEVKKFMV